MRYADFENSTAGKLIPTVSNAKAFVPNPLPPSIDLGKIALSLGNARAALGELKGACRRLRNPYILIRPLQRLEAQTSSAMEGTFTTSDELALAEAGIEQNLQSEAIEVANYTRALAWAKEKLESNSLPISGRLLKGTHGILLRRVGRDRGQDKQPGEYKRDQNMIGGRRLDTARFIPPPPVEAVQAMTDLEKYVNRKNKREGEALIDLAIVHYQFECIHPFADGNGRMGRMLISLMAITEGLLDMPVLYMSPEFETRKDDYIDLMYAVSSKGAWQDWINFFLKVTTISAQRTVQTIDSILKLHESYHNKATEVSRSNNLLAIIDLLFDQPVVQAKTIVKSLEITDAAARTLLRQLVDLEILSEIGTYYPKVWIAAELINISRPDS